MGTLIVPEKYSFQIYICRDIYDRLACRIRQKNCWPPNTEAIASTSMDCAAILLHTPANPPRGQEEPLLPRWPRPTCSNLWPKVTGTVTVPLRKWTPWWRLAFFLEPQLQSCPTWHSSSEHYRFLSPTPVFVAFVAWCVSHLVFAFPLDRNLDFCSNSMTKRRTFACWSLYPYLISHHYMLI